MTSTSTTTGTEWDSAVDLGTPDGREFYLAVEALHLRAVCLGKAKNIRAEALFQHSLREGLFCVLIRLTFPDGSIRHVGAKNVRPRKAVWSAWRELRRFLDEEPISKKKPATGEVSGRRPERESPKGKRGNGLRKGRRSSGRGRTC